MSDGIENVDYGKNAFRMDSKHWIGIMAIHAAVHESKGTGIKYTWIGSGYISNMFFKMIANKPTFQLVHGDMSFDGADGLRKGIWPIAIGDKDGKPYPQTGW